MPMTMRNWTPPGRLISDGVRMSLTTALIACSVAAAVIAAMTLFGSPAHAQTCPDPDNPPTPVAVPVTAVPIVVTSTTADYFVLYVSHEVDGTTYRSPVQVVLGEDGTTTLAESVAALPVDRYRVEKYLIADPADVDGDCIDDITELGDPVGMNPVNPGIALELSHGAVAIPDRATFETLAYPDPGGPFQIKFVLGDRDSDRPSLYFQNTNTFLHHDYFLDALNFDPLGPASEGTIFYDPELVAPDGSRGLYYYSVAGRPSLRLWQRVYTLLAASMPLLDDNLALWVSNRRLPQIQADLALYREPRVNLVFDESVFGETDFLALNPGEGYGLLRSLDADERPHSRDVVIYEALPNELPRVAGIISTVPQTPLSHVNLRALQDGVPNAFIAGALEDETISGLIDSYVHYAVTDDGYSIRAASQSEVDEHYASSRPTEPQTPQRDLSATSITALSEIGFDGWDSFGVKAANVAVIGTLGFPPGTVPDGFAAPFYFYDEFMKHNGLYDEIEEMLADSDFQADYDTQVDELKKLRKKIKKAETPDWIDTALTAMHATFPEGTSLRYRSSTNNEDLPNFNGAGLYDSNTQHPEETVEDGISKSLKQVYASLWNFRAFIERDFYRVDHLAAAMGVLVHPNYSDERVNGVAVSIDPAYGTEGTYYVNSQIGEDLVTNPDARSVPEEVLLYPDGTYTVVALSNQVPAGQLLMTDDQLRQLRRNLAAIHERFAKLYGIEDGEQFAIEIEFKITSDNILAIKQARPWIFSGSPTEIEDPGAEALTGAFVEVPETHIGIPFSATIQFSERLTIGFEDFRDYAVTVTGGSVPSVRRVDRRRDLWVVDVIPNFRLRDVTLVLADNRKCLVVGAICTSDGRRLSNRLEHTVEVPNLRPRGKVLSPGVVDLEWDYVPGADSYEVQYFQSTQWIDLPGDGITVAFDGTGAVVSGLPDSKVYYFRLRAVDFDETSEWSDRLSVQIKNVEDAVKPSSSAPSGGGGGGGGGGGPPPVPIPSDADFDWNVTRDIESLDRDNDIPTGLWSDGQILWVLENAASGADSVFAYDLLSGERQPDREFELDRRNRFSHGIWSDGETVWVADSARISFSPTSSRAGSGTKRERSNWPSAIETRGASGPRARRSTCSTASRTRCSPTTSQRANS